MAPAPGGGGGEVSAGVGEVSPLCRLGDMVGGEDQFP